MGTDSINDRFKFIVDKLFGGNATKFAREFDLRQSTVKDILGQKQNSPSFETLKKVLNNDKYKISPKWLFFNMGDFQELKPEPPTEDAIEKISDLKDKIALQKMVIEMQESELKRLKGE